VKALITGASSGIGRDIAVYLSKMGYDIYVVARRGALLEELKNSLSGNVRCICADLSREDECYRVYDELKNENIDFLINNAGFGVYGEFSKTDLKNELRLIDVNIKAVHILTKLFICDFIKKDYGYILNVASSAGFMMGPLFSSYYASKAYVLRLTQAISRELAEMNSGVKISVLCPGPVKTEFDEIAGVKSSLSGLNSYKVAKLAVDKTLKGKKLIIPGLTMKLSVFFSRFISQNILSKITFICQNKKNGDAK